MSYYRRRLFEEYRGFPPAVYWLCVGAWVNRSGSFLVPFLTIYLTQEQGYEAQFAAWAIAVFGLGSVLASLVGGTLADRVGRKPVIVGSMLGSALLLLLFSGLEGKAEILAWVLVFAVVADSYRPAVAASLADLLPDDRRTHAFGLMYLAINLGFTTAAAIGGWLAARSFSWLFLGDAATCAGFGVIMLLKITETKPTEPPAAQQRPIASELPTATDEEARAPMARAAMTPAATIAHAAPSSRLLTFAVVCIAVTVVGIAFSQAFSNLPIDLARRGIGTEGYGRLLAVNGLLITLLQMPVTSWIDRWHRGRVMVVGALLTGIGFGLKAVVAHPLWLAAAVGVWTLGEILMGPVLPAIASDLAPKSQRGRYLGVLNMLFPLSLIIGGPLGAALLNHWGSVGLWLVALGFGMLGAALYSAIAKNLDPMYGRRRTAGEHTLEPTERCDVPTA